MALNSKKSTRLLFFISLMLIVVIFFVSGAITYHQFDQNIKENELHNQEQMSQIIARLIEQYFNNILLTSCDITSSNVYPDCTIIHR